MVAQTRPRGDSQTAMPRRKRRRRNVRTADSISATDISQESVAPRTKNSEKIHKMPVCITKGEPKLEAAPPASHDRAQPNCSDYSRMDPIPLRSEHIGPAGHDNPAVKPPAEMNRCNTPDTLQREMYIMLVKMADGSPPAEANIRTDLDTLLSKLSEMTVNSERWMERFIMNPQVVCSDSVTSDDNPEEGSLDVDDGDDVFQNLIPTVVSVRPEVTEKWMDRFVVDLVESLSVSRSTFGPAVSEEYSPVVFSGGGGGGGCRCIPPGGRRARPSCGVGPARGSFRFRSVCPASCRFSNFRPFFWGRSPLMRLAWVLARHVSDWIRRKLRRSEQRSEPCWLMLPRRCEKSRPKPERAD